MNITETESPLIHFIDDGDSIAMVVRFRPDEDPHEILDRFGDAALMAVAHAKPGNVIHVDFSR